MKSVDKKSPFCLTWACIRVLWPTLLATIIPKLLFTGFTFGQPFLLQVTVQRMGDGKISPSIVGGLISAMFIIFAGRAVRFSRIRLSAVLSADFII